MFDTKEVAEYYNTTQNHYQKWWNLNKHFSLHYGIWDEGINNFNESLINTNRVLMNIANVTSADKILDAGCGVGGAAIFLTENKKVKVTGISLSEKQIAFANHIAKQKKLDQHLSFHIMDYTKTSFENGSFDLLWACESVSSANDKNDFIKEAYRLLKKGGRLIMSDFFKRSDNQIDRNLWMKKWGATWGISNFSSSVDFNNKLQLNGFKNIQMYDYTDQIQRSARRMYYASLIGAVPSEVYNLFNPKVSRFAKTHYKCGYYQYKALNEGLWKYKIFYAQK